MFFADSIVAGFNRCESWSQRAIYLIGCGGLDILPAGPFAIMGRVSILGAGDSFYVNECYSRSTLVRSGLAKVEGANGATGRTESRVETTARSPTHSIASI